MAQDIVLKGIVSFPTVWEPKQINNKGEPKYSATLILDPRTDWPAVQACIQEALQNRFPTGAPAQWKYPIQPADDEGFPGQGLIRAYSDVPPSVVDQNVNALLERSALFSGCVVNMYMRFYGYDTSGNKGVGVGLNAVQLLDNVNVQRLDNRKDAKQVFEAVPGAPAQLAPTPYSQPAVPPGAPQGGYQPQGAPQGGYPPQGAPQGGYQPQGAPQGGYQPPQAPQGQPQGAPQGGYQPQGAPQGGYQPPQAPQQGAQAPQGQPPGHMPWMD